MPKHAAKRPALAVVSESSPMPFPSAWQSWPGGRFRTLDGVSTYFLRARLGDGVRVELAVGESLNAALAEWALFKGDPAGYRTPKKRAAEALWGGSKSAVRLDLETADAFLYWADARTKTGELSEIYVKGTLRNYVRQWGIALKGRDLHKVTLDDIQALLRRPAWKVAQHKRVVALKAFTRWAREDKPSPKLQRGQDPTIDLMTPKVTPEKSRRKKGYDMPFVERLYAALESQEARDIIRLRACAHGMHSTEIGRLADGDGELERVSDPSGIEGVVTFRHKNGKDHRVSMDAATFAAAERIRARGSKMSDRALLTRLRAVAIKWHGCDGVILKYAHKQSGGHVYKVVPCAKCPKIAPSELRHSFATWAVTIGEEVHPSAKQGVTLAKVAEAMGHLNKNTTARFYRGDHVPMMIRIPINLRHADDP